MEYQKIHEEISVDAGGSASSSQLTFSKSCNIYSYLYRVSDPDSVPNVDAKIVHNGLPFMNCLFEDAEVKIYKTVQGYSSLSFHIKNNSSQAVKVAVYLLVRGE